MQVHTSPCEHLRTVACALEKQAAASIELDWWQAWCGGLGPVCVCVCVTEFSTLGGNEAEAAEHPFALLTSVSLLPLDHQSCGPSLLKLAMVPSYAPTVTNMAMKKGMKAIGVKTGKDAKTRCDEDGDATWYEGTYLSEQAMNTGTTAKKVKTMGDEKWDATRNDAMTFGWLDDFSWINEPSVE